MITTTIHKSCIALVDILKERGIRNVVLSPGSRNAPLITVFSRDDFFDKKIIIDERAAAFFALGMAQQCGKPVVLVCTSGTAMLNYAPAVAEAYYQSIPLIIVTADRSHEWIDQDDSQTIRQNNALSSIVKRSYDIDSSESDWYVNRVLNDALISAITGYKAPVHINMQFANALYDVEKRTSAPARVIERIESLRLPSAEVMESLARQFFASRRVLIIAGFGVPSKRLSQGIDTLASLPNVVVMTETISNIQSDKTIKAIDRTLLAAGDADITPDLLITFGGSLVSRFIKNYLRNHRAAQHWHVSLRDNLIDTMQSLTKSIYASPEEFVAELSKRVDAGKCNGEYNKLLHDINEKGLQRHNEIIETSQDWCDMMAMRTIFNRMPQSGWQLHLSNGTPVRYAQLFAENVTIPCYCNRGVSGIDGATSTAIGSSLVFEGKTLLITGDMSFLYDLGGLASQYKNPKIKIIVMCNGGGGIFRFISGESEQSVLENFYEVHYDYRIAEIASAMGYDVLNAVNKTELECSLDKLFASETPTVLLVHTPGDLSGKTLKNYFNIKIWQQEIGKQ